MARVLCFGACWIGLLAVVAAFLGVPAPQRVTPQPVTPDPVKPPAHMVSLSAVPPPPRAGTRYPGWTVTRAYSAHHMMVVEVETERLADSSRIAAQVVEPLKYRYDEVLIYVRGPGQRADDLPARRIQWTLRTGYVESVYAR